jgi:hypothetical protein
MLQHANVSIDNCSSKDIVGVTVVHKYCKNYTSQHEFGEVVIKKGESSAVHEIPVEYNTDWATTGRDWWNISWVTSDGYFCMTDPDNLRELLDFSEQLEKMVIPVGVFLGVAILSKFPALGMLVERLGDFVIENIFNSTTTTGFKQLILGDEDADHLVQMRIDDTKVTIHSFTSKATVGYRKTKLGVAPNLRQRERAPMFSTSQAKKKGEEGSTIAPPTP